MSISQFSPVTSSQPGLDDGWLAVHPAGLPGEAVVEPDGPAVPVGFPHMRMIWMHWRHTVDPRTKR